MLFERIYDEGLAQASYLIACQRTGEALVVDARRDVEEYLRLAERHRLRIAAVTETHVHADYLSGSRELAARTGARLLLSAEGGPDWTYGFAHEPLRDGGEIRLGNVSARAVHSSGHTPEHLAFLVTDGAASSEPGIALTGDWVFVGDVGRPDLLDEAAGGQDTRFEGARALIASLRERFLTLPDWVSVWPGHGAGSACGKALGALPGSTVGYERRFAWWAASVRANDLARFTSELLAGQPDAPSYFARMKRQNLAGPALLGERPPLERLSPEGTRAALDGGALLVDSRPRAAYQAGAVPGSLHLPAGRTFSTWAGWLLDPERDPRPLVLVAPDQEAAGALRDELARVGVDDVAGFVPTLEGLPLEPQPPLEPAALAAMPDALVLDVRARTEWEAGHLPGAARVNAGRLLERLPELPRDRPVVVHCQSGARSAAAASLLRAHGLPNAMDLAGGLDAWERAARD